MDRRDWRPMRPYRGRRQFELIDPVVEPFWSGGRVMAHVTRRQESDPDVSLIEDLGTDVASTLPDVAAAFGRSVRADSAVIDVVITSEVGLSGVGAAAIPEVKTSSASILLRNDADVAVVRRDDAAIEKAAEVTGIVAGDLLEVDGSELLDVPLLERKRLLESVIDESDIIRTSIHARPPWQPWVTTWKSLGLRGAMLKAANSRYEPGGDSIEWRIVESAGRRA